MKHLANSQCFEEHPLLLKRGVVAYNYHLLQEVVMIQEPEKIYKAGLRNAFILSNKKVTWHGTTNPILVSKSIFKSTYVT